MKLLHTVVILMCVLKWAATKPLNATSSFNISAPAAELVEYYNDEYDLLAQEICSKLKNITDEILKDVIVQKSVSPLVQTLKKNLTEFQQYYSYFQRFGLNGTLVSEFSELIKGFYYTSGSANDSDYSHIQQQLKKLGYNEIRDTQRDKFKTFFEEKFLIKFAQLQADFNNKSESANKDLEVLKWISFLKECRDYECFLMDFSNYKRIHAGLLDRFFGEMFRDLFKMLIVHADNTTVFAQAVLTDARLSQLSAPFKQQLIKNLQDIIKVQESFVEFTQIFFFHHITYLLLYRFDDYANISLKDRQLITIIFNEHGYESLHFDTNEEKLAKIYYITQYENKRAALTLKELTHLKSILELMDRLLNASGPQEKAETFKSIAKLLNESAIFK